MGAFVVYGGEVLFDVGVVGRKGRRNCRVGSYAGHEEFADGGVPVWIESFVHVFHGVEEVAGGLIPKVVVEPGVEDEVVVKLGLWIVAGHSGGVLTSCVAALEAHDHRSSPI